MNRDHSGLCSYDSTILAVGGTCSETRRPLKAIESFNHQTRTWDPWESSLIIEREGPGVIQIDEKVYVIGGRGLEVLGTIEIYDSRTQTWTLGNDDLKVKHENQEYSVVLLEVEAE